MEKSAVIAGLGALAQETRLDIVRYLVRKGGEGAPAGDVGEHVKVPSATLAFHLNILTGAGLLVRRRVSRNVIYRVDYGRLHAITAYLLENCCVDSGEKVARAERAAGATEPADIIGLRTRAASRHRQRRR
jgi:DNA-binding transcriptional ArsR family regulator